jgi:hypothetical protein
MEHAAENGHLGIIEYFFDRYDQSKLTGGSDCLLRASVCGGHLHITKYLEKFGYVLTDRMFYEAARNGRVGIVDYFVQEGWQITGQIVEGAVNSKSPEMIEWIMERVPRGMIAGQMEWIMRTHNFPLMTQLLSEGFALPRNAGEIAARYYTLNMMKFVSGTTMSGCGVQYTSEAYSWVFHWDKDPHEKVKYLVEVGCPIDSTVCRKPAETADMPTIEYLMERGAKFDDLSMFMAAYRQRHVVLKYAKSLGYDVLGMVYRASYSADVQPNERKNVRKWINTVKYL